MSREQSSGLRLVRAGVIFVLLPLLVSCHGHTIKCNGFIQPDPNRPVEAGKVTVLTVDVDNPADELLTFAWRVDRGIITVPSERAKSAIYKAPDTAGEDTVTVQVSGNRKVVDEQSIKLHVSRPQTISLGAYLFQKERDEMQLHLVFKPVPGLHQDDGVDLSDYDLQITFLGGDGKNLQLYYRNNTWANVYSSLRPITSNQPIRFNPTTDRSDVRQFSDFSHIYSVGAQFFGGMDDIKIVSAKLINRNTGGADITSP
jgi:hypothetical protein